MSNKRVYAVVSQLPIPQDRGDAVRTIQILQALDAQFHLTVLSALRKDSSSDDVTVLSQILRNSTILTFSDGESTRGNYATRVVRWVRSTVNREPPWIYGRRSPQLARHLRTLPYEDAIYIAISEASGSYVDRKRAWHWDKMNVLGESSRAEIENAQSPLAHIRSRAMNILCLSFERRIVAKSRSISVTSSLELQRLTDLYSVTGRETCVWPSCAEAKELVETRPIGGPRVVAWLGSLSYPANLHGLTEFLEQGWAPMGDAGYRMRVIGQGLSLANQSVMVNRFPGIEFTGFVENLGDALADVHVAVAPLWSGAGVKMKTLTLMGFGIPVYGTSVAFEGIDVADLGVVFDDPIELSQKVLNSSDKSLEDIGIEMKNRVHRDHSHTALAKAVADSMNKLAELV